MSSSAHGYFVWHDLITTDIPAATQFYKKVVGWTTQAFDPEGTYMMWANKNGPIGGIGPAGDEVAPHWRPYIGTDDITATIQLAQNLGGTVVTPATDISNGGKWAVLKDPQGNEFGVYWSENNPVPEMKMQPGEFHWHELATGDYKSVFNFYQQLFGWEPAREHDMGEMGMYALFKNEGRPQGMGGMFNKPASMPGGGWRTYTIVKDVGKAAAAIKKLGGKITQPPVEVPGGSWTLKFTDPQGVSHALTSTENASAKPGEPKAPQKKNKTASVNPGAKTKTKSSKTAAVTKSTAKPAKKKAVKKAAAKKTLKTKSSVEKKELKKIQKKDEKKKKKELKKQKKLEKKLRKKEKKEKKKEKAKRKK